MCSSRWPRCGRCGSIPRIRKKGIICQELLYFGYRPLPPLLELTSTNTLAPVELAGLHLEFPKNCEGQSMVSVRANWDWQLPWKRRMEVCEQIDTSQARWAKFREKAQQKNGLHDKA